MGNGNEAGTAYDSGRLAIQELASDAQAPELPLDRNEATTRLHLIDRLLFDALGWVPADVVAEDRFENTYADYILGSIERRAIIEAKREGVAFEVPVGTAGGVHSIQSLTALDRRVDSAMRQVQAYCAERGVAIAAIANGHQLIAFIGTRGDGVPPLEGRALVFPSLADMVSRFSELWEALSPAGLAGKYLQRRLAAEGAQPPPDKLSAGIAAYPGFRRRNELNTELKILGQLFLEDLIAQRGDEDEFLKRCYAPSGALSQYALVSREILRSQYPTGMAEAMGLRLESVQSKRGVNPQLMSDLVSAGLASRPIILLGDVGVGKTMFIRHLVRIEARQELADAIVLDVDFGREPALASDLRSFVTRRFVRQLRDDYGVDIDKADFVRAVYEDELTRFEDGIYGELKSRDAGRYADEELALLARLTAEQESHLRASLEFMAERDRRPIVIILDNIDQRPFEFQEEVFLISQTLAQTWPGTVFVSLRPSTFHRSKREGYLAAYQPRAFTIAPPRVDRVVEKRLKYGREQIHRVGRLPTFPAGVTLHSDTLADYIGVLESSFRVNTRLMEMLDNLSAGNVRLALELITTFVGSAHVDTRKILDIYNKSGYYQIAPHEFLRAILYGENEHYDAEASPICNVFDISRYDGREHFLLPGVVLLLERLGGQQGSEGFVGSGAIYEAGQEAGFDTDQIREALARAVRKRVLATTIGDSDVDGYRATAVGVYTVRRLLREFSYVDAVIVDTPVVNVAARTQIHDARSIQERLARFAHFVNYLDSQWELTGGSAVGAFDWFDVSRQLRAQAQQIAERIGHR